GRVNRRESPLNILPNHKTGAWRRQMNTERGKDIVVPLIGTAFAFVSSVLSAILIFYTSDRNNKIQEDLKAIQTAQFAAEQRARATQFDRESERQYISLFYQEIVSEDAKKQRAALSLVKILEPGTGLKLINWAQESGVLRGDNKEKTQQVE